MTAPGVHVVLDRDGVLNRETGDGWVDSVAAWAWEDGALEGLRQLARPGVVVSVVTNQSGIGRGAVRPGDVDALHRWLTDEITALGVDLNGIFVCPRPRPSFDVVAANLHQAWSSTRSPPLASTPAATWMIGDAGRDLDAGRAAGVAVALIATGKGGGTREMEPDVVYLERLGDLLPHLGLSVVS